MKNESQRLEGTVLMTKLLVFKEYLKRIYSRYSAYVEPTIKFIVAVMAMMVLSMNIGFMPILKNPAIVVIIGLVCAFIPVNLILGILIAFMVANIYALSPELALIIIIIMIVMYILFFRFTPADGYVLILMPVLFFMKIPYVLPVIMGLVATPISVISVSFGILLYFLIYYIGSNAATIANLSTDSELQKITTILIGVFNNKEMYLIMAAFGVTLILVYVIRKKSMDYAWNIAVITGGIINILIILSGVILLGLETITPVWGIVVASLLSIGIVYIIQLFILSVDYSRTEYVQFEDEDYYYYVKAVPKVNVAVQDVKVKRINARKARRSSRQ